jgi:hypothetical protein
MSVIALMMEAASTSETMVNFYQTTWCYNPEDNHLNMFLHSKKQCLFPLKDEGDAIHNL